MNAHEQLERFLKLALRTKIIIAFVLLVIVISIPVAAYFAGKSAARQQADSAYLSARDQRLQEIAALEAEVRRRIENEKQLSAENAFLRKQTEAAAEILRNNDAVLRGDAGKFTDLLEKRNEKIKEIDADTDFDAQLCGLCQDAASSGFRLSDNLCRRCPANP